MKYRHANKICYPIPLVQETEFCTAFIHTLFKQLQYAPESFFDESEVTKDNFLVPALSALFGSLGARADLSSDVAEHVKRLMMFMRKKFGAFAVRDYEYSPRTGGVSAVAADSASCSTFCRIRMNEEESFNMMEEDMPVVVDAKHLFGDDGSDRCVGMDMDMNTNMNNMDQGPSEVMSFTELQDAKYSWRFPLLFAEMERHNKSVVVSGVVSGGREDMLMTAVRLLEECQSGSSLSIEAHAFVQMEAPHF